MGDLGTCVCALAWGARPGWSWQRDLAIFSTGRARLRHRAAVLYISYIYGNFGAGRNEWAQEKGTACFRQRFRPRYRDGGTSPRGDGTICLLCTPQVRSAGANDMHPGGGIARGEWTPRRRPAGEPVARQMGPSPRGNASARAHTIYHRNDIYNRPWHRQVGGGGDGSGSPPRARAGGSSGRGGRGGYPRRYHGGAGVPRA